MSRQFDICHLRGGDPGSNLVVVIQHDRLIDWRTRVVARLAPQGLMKQVHKLHPVIVHNGDKYVVAVDQIATVRAADLGPPLSSLEAQRDEIIAALDILVTGI